MTIGQMVGGFFLLIPTRDSGFAELMAGHRPNLVNDSGALFRVFKLSWQYTFATPCYNIDVISDIGLITLL